MKITKTIILVQDQNECAAEFAERIDKYLLELSMKHVQDLIHYPKIKFMTTAASGRQTATISYTTDSKAWKIKSENEKVTREVYASFPNKTDETNELIEFLLKNRSMIVVPFVQIAKE